MSYDPLARFEAGEVPAFHQRLDIFSRAFWDPAVRSDDAAAFFASYRTGAEPRRGEGFGQKDFALRNAAWAMSDIISERSAAQGAREGFQGAIRDDTEVAKARAPMGAPEEEAAEVKAVARFLGADLVGICARDERWHYASRPDVRDFSDVPAEAEAPWPGQDTVIVMGHEMDAGLTDAYPSALASAGPGREYSREAGVAIALATYLRGLGWRATASMNDTALAVPYAILAGLGEYGRHQMVITPEFGPRVRFSKVFTDMPLGRDAPRPMGITAYCEGCTICADACPPRALPHGEARVGTFDGSGSPSTIGGVRKWSANCEACFGYWAKLRSDCAICMRVCPFNRDGSRVSKLWYRLATGERGARGVALARRWAAGAGARPRLRPRAWWAAARGG